MSSSIVQYHLQDSIGIIRIDNPPVNALSQAVRQGVADALKAAATDDARAVLIVCIGKTFIAGADITEFGKPPQPPSLPELIAAIESHPRPVVAVLHGNALGGGLEVAMAAHYRCALPGTRLGLPEVNLGLLPGAGGTQRLPRLVGVKAAMDMILGGKPINADRAQTVGLVDALVEGDPETAGIAFAQKLLQENAAPRPTGERAVPDIPGASYFDTERQRVASRFRGQIAPGFIVDLVEKATHLPVEEGMVLERERFIECRNSPQSAALRHVFFAERATGKVPGISTDLAVRPVAQVAVIGAGTMGGGIAMNFAQAGIAVTLVETGQEALDRGLALVRKNYETSQKRGRFTAEQIQTYLSNITGTTDYADISEVDVVVELASDAGAGGDETRAALGDQAVKDRLRRATDLAVERGVFGSPFFIVDGEPFWGNDRLDELDEWLESGGW